METLGISGNPCYIHNVDFYFQDFKKYQKMIEGRNVVDGDDDDESGVDVTDSGEANNVDAAQGII